MQEEMLEHRLKMLENAVMSLNTLWKMSIILQGPTFTESVIKDLANALAADSSNPIIRDAKNGLENAMKVWKGESGGSFGLEEMENRLEVLQARQVTLEFITFLNLLQQGPRSMNAMLHGIENRNTREGEDVSETFKEASDRVFDYFKKEISTALRAYLEVENEEEKEVARA